MTTDVSVTLSVVEGSHVRPPHALREMSRQARHDRNIIKICVNLSNLCHLCAIKHNDKLSFNKHLMKIRVGFGYDVHRLVEGRELWLGGIRLNHEKGLLGHSDADVLIHAVCDALLGAANMRDIGYHFPDTAGEYENIDSKILLRKTVELIAGKGYEVGNIDATVCAERPKLKAHIPEMQRVMADVMGVAPDDVSVKATTTEKLGFTGREEGIAAYATVLIVRKD